MLLSGLSNSTSSDPASQTATAQIKLEEDLNSFLNLLVTQLKNQDPLDPLDANEFTSQLVQFASVEQQIYANSNLERLLNLQQTSQVASMVDYLGTTVEATGDTLMLDDGKAEFTYTVDATAISANLTIRNSAGLTVFSTEGESSAGTHKFVWDGTSAGGQAQPEGIYTVIVNALDRDGNVTDVSQTVFGKVTGAGAENGEVSLFMGDVIVPMSNVVSVRETKNEAEPLAGS
jgi:flagellar basal-body rod modification protein FlgD